MNSFLQLFELIGELARRRFQEGERYFSAIGLNHTEARLLSALYQEKGKCEQDILSSYLHVDKSNAGRGLKRLEQEGYLERKKVGTDKRKNIVQITEKGRSTVTEIQTIREKMSKSFFGELSVEEAAQAIVLLQKALAGKQK